MCSMTIFFFKLNLNPGSMIDFFFPLKRKLYGFLTKYSDIIVSQKKFIDNKMMMFSQIIIHENFDIFFIRNHVKVIFVFQSQGFSSNSIA